MAQPSTSPVVVSPWGKREVSQVKSFMDVMDEEYAKQLEEKDLKEKKEEDGKWETVPSELQTDSAISNESQDVANTTDASSGEDTGHTGSDLMVARLLQLDFDRENDEYVRSLEKNYNGSNKVSMSFKNFYSQHPYDMAASDDLACQDDSSDEESDEDEVDGRNATQKGKHGGEIITKHNSEVTERRNAKNIEQFPSNFQVGDVHEGMRLPNHVYNKLKLHSMKEEKGEMRVHEKQEHSTHEKALDEQTRLILYKMVNNGSLDSLGGIIATGKESIVIHAKGGQIEGESLPGECALKVYKTTLNEFKTREKYIKDDHRFKERYSKQNPRKIIKLWAEKEFRNLKRMEEAGIKCPKALLLRKHVLVLSFVGIDRVAAPKLKDAPLSKTQYTQAYFECIEAMRTLYVKCNLVHADFSEYNVLWHANKCVFIDVSQSVELIHPHAFHFLLRDCENITHFFTKSGVSDVMKANQLFQYVCGKQLEMANLDEIENECKENFDSNKERLTYGIDSQNFAFDYHFKQTEQSRNVVAEETPVEALSEVGHSDESTETLSHHEEVVGHEFGEILT